MDDCQHCQLGLHHRPRAIFPDADDSVFVICVVHLAGVRQTGCFRRQVPARHLERVGPGVEWIGPRAVLANCNALHLPLTREECTDHHNGNLQSEVDCGLPWALFGALDAFVCTVQVSHLPEASVAMIDPFDLSR
jgi:hypothetical protein